MAAKRTKPRQWWVGIKEDGSAERVPMNPYFGPYVMGVIVESPAEARNLVATWNTNMDTDEKGRLMSAFATVGQ